MSPRSGFWKIVGAGIGGLLIALGGCAQQDHLADLKQKVRALERTPPGRIEPLPELKPYESYVYQAAGQELRDPFEAPEQPEAEQLAGGPEPPGVKPPEPRPKEPLELVPLDSLRMVGTLEAAQGPSALVKGPDGTIYRVAIGNHLGQNYGEIVSITEARIQLVELVTDAQGQWQERNADIDLTE